MKAVPQADAKSASMGWFFDPGFIQNVQRVAADVENPSMESIDSVLFALREMGYIKTAATCEHGCTVDKCVSGMCEMHADSAYAAPVDESILHRAVAPPAGSAPSGASSQYAGEAEEPEEEL
jgi:hypothetical protein